MKREWQWINMAPDKEAIYHYNGRLQEELKTKLYRLVRKGPGKVQLLCYSTDPLQAGYFKGLAIPLKMGDQIGRVEAYSLQALRTPDGDPILGNHHHAILQVEQMTFGKIVDSTHYNMRFVFPLRDPLKWNEYFKGGASTETQPWQIEVEQTPLSVWQTQEDEQDMLVIQAIETISYRKMLATVQRFLMAIGFFTGCFINDEVYAFIYSTGQLSMPHACRYRRLSGTLTTPHTPVGLPPLLREKMVAIRNIDPATFQPSMENVVALADLLAEDIALEQAISLLLISPGHPHPFQPLAYQSALCYVINFYLRKRLTAPHPILYSPADGRKQVVIYLQHQLRKYDGPLHDDLRDLYHKQLSELLYPPMQQYIEFVFAKANIHLTTGDLWAVRYPHPYRHLTGDATSFEQMSATTTEATLRLITLSHLLILFLAGYKGYVLDQYLLNANKWALPPDEQIYRQVK